MIVATAIETHRVAVMRASQFDDDMCPDGDAACAAELEAFRALILAPCADASEVQAKVAYLLDGKMPINSTVSSMLDEYGDDLVEGLLRSIRLKDVHTAHPLVEAPQPAPSVRELTQACLLEAENRIQQDASLRASAKLPTASLLSRQAIAC